METSSYPVVLRMELRMPATFEDRCLFQAMPPLSFIGRTDVEAETPILWLPDAKSWLIGKDPDAGKDWGHDENRKTEDEMVGWHHRLDGCGFGWTLGVGDGQGGLACCGSWGRKESDMTERLNWTELMPPLGLTLGASQSLRWRWFLLPIKFLVYEKVSL